MNLETRVRSTAMRDAARIADAYSVSFPQTPRQPNAALVTTANSELAGHLNEGTALRLLGSGSYLAGRE